jgi:hypothetical protein
MKLVTFTAMVMLLSAGYAFAGGGAPVPEGSQAAPPSGVPGAVLDDAKCQAVWTKAAGAGGTSLSYDKAGPYITNLKLADPDNDKEVSKTEFTDACKKGLVQEQPSKPAATGGGGQTPENPTKP